VDFDLFLEAKNMKDGFTFLRGFWFVFRSKKYEKWIYVFWFFFLFNFTLE